MKKDEFDIQYVLKHFYKVPIKSIMDRKIWDLPLVSKDTPIEDIFSIMTARRHAWDLREYEKAKILLERAMKINSKNKVAEMNYRLLLKKMRAES